jgi:two-component system chemotaxis sensor kinase CheA
MLDGNNLNRQGKGFVMLSTHQRQFKEEANQILGELEASLLELRSAPHNMDAVTRVFRATHFLNKGGEMFGFEAVAAFAGEIESVFELVRNGKIPITLELTKLTLAASARIREMLRNFSNKDNIGAAVQEQFRSLGALPYL